MKKFSIVCLCFVLSLCFAACNRSDCNHEFIPTDKADVMVCRLCAETKKAKTEKADPQHSHSFSEPTCEAPAACACGETQGQARGHFFSTPTCTTPATCSACGKTQGAPLGHKLSASSCTSAALCTICGQKQGDALGHDFSEATCQAKATCTRCGETTGEKAKHSYNGKVCTYCGQEDPSSYITVTLAQGTPIYKTPSNNEFVEFLSSGGKFTIVEERTDDYGNRWGRLKSGKGWVILSDPGSTPPSGITVSAAEITLDQVKSNHKFYSVNEGEYTVVICLRINKTVKNLKFSSSNAGAALTQHFTLSSLSANAPLSVQIELHDFTEMHLSFEEGGVRRNFSIYESGRDGSLIVTEK